MKALHALFMSMYISVMHYIYCTLCVCFKQPMDVGGPPSHPLSTGWLEVTMLELTAGPGRYCAHFHLRFITFASVSYVLELIDSYIFMY